MKTIVSQLVLLTLFSISTFAANSPPRQKRVLKADTGEVFSVAFSPDSRSVASGCGWPRYGINLWNVRSGQPKSPSIEYTEQATASVTFSPDGSTLASGGWNRTVHLWEVASGQLKVALTGHSERVSSVAFSPDGLTLASGSLDKTLRLWDVASGQSKMLFIGHTEYVRSVAFSPDGLTLASGSSDDTIRLWDAISGETKAILTGHKSGVYSVSFSPDGQILASGSSDNTIRLWEVSTGKHLHTLSGHSERVRSVAFSPDGLTLASGSDDRTVRLWDIASGQPIAILIGHTDRVTSVAFSPDGSTLASGGDREDRTVILWDLTASATTPAVLSISPVSIKPSTIGEKLTVSLNIVGGENVMGYQATVVFDPAALIYFSSANGDYLPDGAFFAAPVVEKNSVTLTSVAGVNRGDGTLATITFQVVDTKASRLFLSQASLVDPEGERLFPCIENGEVIEPVYLAEDVNNDGVVNIQDMVLVSSNFGKRDENKADVNGDGVVDIVDLVKVAAALGNAAAAPSF